MSKLAVVGTGYVGLVTAACFAELGHTATCLEIDKEKLASLNNGHSPFYEPGLEELVQKHRSLGRLHFTDNYAEGLGDSQFIFVTVNTPSDKDGNTDLRFLALAAESIAAHGNSNSIVVIKSTMPIGTSELVAEMVARQGNPNLAVVANPELLREGSAIEDFLHPFEIIIGSTDREAAKKVAQLYEPCRCPIIICDPRTAEFIKYASNAFRAVKISFINEMASLCERVGANVSDLVKALVVDPDVGPTYLQPGLGWGGSCLPKDARALIHTAKAHQTELPLLEAAARVNWLQRKAVVSKLQGMLGCSKGVTIGILGLAFKPNTDDLREAPSVDIITLLQEEGHSIRAYDPVAGEKARMMFPGLTLCSDAYEVASGSDALVLVTEWEEFRHLDLKKLRSLMRQPFFVDGRNLYDPEEMIRAGFVYEGMGRRRMEGVCQGLTSSG